MKHLPLLFLSLVVAAGIALPQLHASAEVNTYTASDDDTVESLTLKLNELFKRYESVKKQLQDKQGSSGSSYTTSYKQGSYSSWHTSTSTKPSTPTPAACSFPWTKTLSTGSRGNEVSDLQKSLKAQGYFSDEPTGYYGEKTEDAVKKFQKYHNIVSSGSSYTTGYGSFGNQTRSVFTRVCGGSSHSSSTSFDIDDVEKVTKKTVDPMPNAADDEYTLYTITLENNKVVKVKACGFCTTQMREKQFTDAGYTGDVDDLIALATVEDEDEDDDTSSAQLEATPVLGETPLSVVFTIDGEEGKTYKLDFGDRTSKKVVADEDTVTHIYKRVGEFTAKLFSRVYSRSWSNTSSLLDSVKITVDEEEEDADDANSEDEDEEESEDEEENEDEEEDDTHEGSSYSPWSSPSSGTSYSSGSSSSHDSCTTTYQSKTVAHGTYVSGYSPYFWQGPMPLTVVSPAKQCQDGAWKQAGYCNLNGVTCTSL